MDYPYIVLLALLLCLFAYSLYSRSHKRYCGYISALAVFFFVALRAPVVGGDTIDYVRLVEGSKLGIYTYFDHVEALYRAYNAAMSYLLFKNGVTFLIVHTFLCLSPFYLLARKYSLNMSMTCLLFMVMMMYPHYMSALRQILGMGILFLGMWYFLENKRWKWYVFVGSGVLGYFMHSSIFITFFLYFACYFIRYNTKIVPYTAIIVSAAVGRLLHLFSVNDALNLLFVNLNSISELDRMNSYLEWSLAEDDNAGLLRLLSSSLIALAFFYMMTEKQATHWFARILLVGIVINNLFVGVRMLDRLLLPLMMFATICYTWMFNARYTQARGYTKNLYQGLLVLCIAYMSQSYYKQNTNYDKEGAMLLHPYYFFWQDYGDHPALRLR